MTIKKKNQTVKMYLQIPLIKKISPNISSTVINIGLSLCVCFADISEILGINKNRCPHKLFII